MKHPCEVIYELGAQGIRYGETAGTCRITGRPGVGLPFKKWVKDTFTDHDWLRPGDIVSNEALFSFDEKSEIIRQMTGREKPQRFRTYSHVVVDGAWHVFTKANKREIFEILTTRQPEIMALSEDGQKHVLFKHRMGLWQLGATHLTPNVGELIRLHDICRTLLDMGFSQTELISGDYMQYRIMKTDIAEWRRLEALLKVVRGGAFFDFVTFLLFN